jgi:hypothetical protein
VSHGLAKAARLQSIAVICGTNKICTSTESENVVQEKAFGLPKMFVNHEGCFVLKQKVALRDSWFLQTIRQWRYD